MKKKSARTRRPQPPAEEIRPNLPCANAASLNEEVTEWLWAGRVPLKNATLLAGAGDMGKSTVATAIAAAVTCGLELPGGPRGMQPRAVLWYGTEESANADIRPRLRVNGAVLARVFFPELNVDGSSRPRPRLPRDMAKVLDLALQVDAGLIVWDPITSYAEEGSNPDTGMVARPVVESLIAIAKQANCACVLIKHPKKFVPGGTPLDQISGHKDWTNVPRSVLLCTPHPDKEDVRCLVQMKKNKSEKRAPTLVFSIANRDGLPMIVWEEEANFSPEELLDVSTSPADRDTLADAKAILIDRLSQGEQKSKELLLWLQEAGVPVSTSRKAKKMLKITSHTVGPNEQRYHVWRAPVGGFPKDGA